jgi:hypothetical protein
VTVQLFRRKILVQAFRLPLWGQAADETPPQWLVSRLQSGELEINSLGGLTLATPFGLQSCAAGDVVIFHADNSIGFEKPETFDEDFEPVSADQLLKAA